MTTWFTSDASRAMNHIDSLHEAALKFARALAAELDLNSELADTGVVRRVIDVTDAARVELEEACIAFLANE